ncbi:radical SAM protein, partial [Candidatus Moduliflexota bacterium]
RACGVDRPAGEKGFCGAGNRLQVAAFAVHRGEEPPLSGTCGSGNIFFTGCSLACIFCQNYPVSRLGTGRALSPDDLAREMLRLQDRGVHNINLVTPTPWIPQILEALAAARDGGLTLPIVFNSGGYESVGTLALLEGAVDIWLPDMKYGSDGRAWRFSRAPHYGEVNRLAVTEMARQTGSLDTDGEGIACRGVLVRHLVLPGGVGDTAAVLLSLKEIGGGLPLSLMFQYFPAWRAVGHPVLGRRLWIEECLIVEKLLDGMPEIEGWKQDYG